MSSPSYIKTADPHASAPEPRPSGLEQDRQMTNGNSLQQASTPMTGMGEHTVAANRLPSPPATAGHTMGSHPGVKNPSSPGIKLTGVGTR